MNRLLRPRIRLRLRLNRDNRKWPAPIIMEWARIVLRSRGFLFACRCRAGVRPGLMPDSLVPHISAPVDAPFPRAPIGWCFQEGIGGRIAKVWSSCQEKRCQFGILAETLARAREGTVHQYLPRKPYDGWDLPLLQTFGHLALRKKERLDMRSATVQNKGAPV
jgi:hypothetical protein